jgi:hypothetical protein
MARRWLIGLVLVGSLVLAAGGCGHSTRGAVKGKVTVNGVPLEEGDISFVPLDPKLGPTAGAPIAHGGYQIDAAKGPVAGEYRVQINAFRKTGKKVWDGMGDERAPASQKNYVEEVRPYIPAKYNNMSELRAKIVAGKVNEYDFDLKLDKAGR